jgi:hypothetical protein
MFFVCDGNLRLKAWTGLIKRLHSSDRSWHYSVDSICLDARGKGGLLLNAMHDINKCVHPLLYCLMLLIPRMNLVCVMLTCSMIL